MTAPLPNLEPTEVRRALKLFLEAAEAVEIRIPEARMVTTTGRPDPRAGTYYGYFDDAETAATVLEKALWEAEFSGVYVTLNPVPEKIAARALNRLKMAGRKEPTTGDKDVPRRRRLLMDFDPSRPSGISSTDEEKAAAYDKAIQVRDDLRSLGWPEPILADSGNGWHLIYAIDLPAADATVPAVLGVLSSWYSDEKVTVDKTVGNAARICKLYGTLARKGDSTPDRPHRMSRIVSQPETLVPVSPDLLADMAADKEASAPSGSSTSSTGPFDLAEFVARHFPGAEPKPWNDGTRWPLPACPFESSHTGGSAAILRNSDGVISFKCQHDSCSAKRWQDLRELLEPGSTTKKHGRTKNDDEPRELVVENLADVKPEPISWLWDFRIARGKVNLYLGKPGEGKSLLLGAEVSARVTKGIALPGSEPFGPADVIIASAEDGLADTIRPRLDAAGGDPSRVYSISIVKQGDREIFLTLADVDLIEDLVRLKSAKLVIIDPLMAFLGKADSHRDQDVRAALAPLAKMAERTGAAVVVIVHLNKQTDTTSAIYRSGGSIGIVGAARTAFLVAPHPDNPALHVIACVKSNIGPRPLALAYRIEEAPNGSARILFESDPLIMTADQLLAGEAEAAHRDEGALAEAEDFLRDQLGAGPKPASALTTDAKTLGIAVATLRRAKKKLKVRAEKTSGRSGGWEWTLIKGGKGEQSLPDERGHEGDDGEPHDTETSGARVEPLADLEHLEPLEHLADGLGDEEGAQGAQDAQPLHDVQGEHVVAGPDSDPSKKGDHDEPLPDIEHLEQVEHLSDGSDRGRPVQERDEEDGTP